MRRRLPAPRLAWFDYRRSGAYFVTMSTHRRRPTLAAIWAGGLVLTRLGQLVEEAWRALPRHYRHVHLDAFVVMPDHIHGIVCLRDLASNDARRHGLSEIVRNFKSFSARAVNAAHGTAGSRVWHRGFYERVIRDEDHLHAVRSYIAMNPSRWVERYGSGSERAGL